MVDQGKAGRDWQREELDAIVADYFAMLSEELSRRSYIKARFRQSVEDATGRSPGSVEYKFQNISAVLEAMGLPRIDGYKPARNYQGALFEAIDHYLSHNPEALERVPQAQPAIDRLDAVFVPVPAAVGDEAMPEGLRKLVRKFDPVERDRLNRQLGEAGERFVIDIEREVLTSKGRADLARRVRWVSAEDGDGAGYDVLSFDPRGRERLLEVKTTNGPCRTPFFLSRNEFQLAERRPNDWRLYRVHRFSNQPQIFAITPPLEDTVQLRPESWRAQVVGIGARGAQA